MSEPCEYRTVISCTEKLEISLFKPDRAIVHFLHKEGFITEEVHEDVLNPRSMLNEHKKAGELVAGIRNKVKLSSLYYHTLLDHLRQRGGKYYEGIVNILDQEYSRQQQTVEAMVSDESSSSAKADLVYPTPPQPDINFRNIQDLFTTFVSTIRISVQEKKISCEELCAHLLDIPVLLKDDGTEKIKLLSGKASKLLKASSINDIFDILMECCSFLEYSILESLVVQYNLDKQGIFRYSEDVDEYLKLHMIKEFTMLNPALGKRTVDSEKLFIKFNISMTAELGKVMHLKSRVAHILGLRESALQILDISKSRVVVTFLISKWVSNYLFFREDLFTKCISELRALSVVWLKNEDKVKIRVIKKTRKGGMVKKAVALASAALAISSLADNAPKADINKDNESAEVERSSSESSSLLNSSASSTSMEYLTPPSSSQSLSDEYSTALEQLSPPDNSSPGVNHKSITYVVDTDKVLSITDNSLTIYFGGCFPENKHCLPPRLAANNHCFPPRLAENDHCFPLCFSTRLLGLNDYCLSPWLAANDHCFTSCFPPKLAGIHFCLSPRLAENEHCLTPVFAANDHCFRLPSRLAENDHDLHSWRSFHDEFLSISFENNHSLPVCPAENNHSLLCSILDAFSNFSTYVPSTPTFTSNANFSTNLALTYNP